MTILRYDTVTYNVRRVLNKVRDSYETELHQIRDEHEKSEKNPTVREGSPVEKD